MIQAFQGKYKKRELLEKLEQHGYKDQIDEWQTMAVIALALDLRTIRLMRKKISTCCCSPRRI
ncbi:hypothetical protein HMSSN036_78480 [Paenibacillus macerans]|nr:hypothetical protein HMSSN036_78480 [Paenibacillus macerans]